MADLWEQKLSFFKDIRHEFSWSIYSMVKHFEEKKQHLSGSSSILDKTKDILVCLKSLLMMETHQETTHVAASLSSILNVIDPETDEETYD
jgi:hypothetical protein